MSAANWGSSVNQIAAFNDLIDVAPMNFLKIACGAQVRSSCLAGGMSLYLDF